MKVKVRLGESVVDGVLVRQNNHECMVKVSNNRVIFCQIDNVIFLKSSKMPVYIVSALLIFIWFAVRFYHGF